MKRFIFAFLALLSVGFLSANPAFDERSGNVFITSAVNKPLVVKWRTGLSDTVWSIYHSAKIPPSARRFQAASRVDWFKTDTKSALNSHIYEITVQVFDKLGTTLLSERTFMKTVSRSKLFGSKPMDNMRINIGPTYGISIYIGK